MGRRLLGRQGRWIAPAHDLLVASVSLPAALVLRVGTEHVPDYFDFLSYGTPLFCVIAAGVFPRCGLYKGLWRYASLADLAAIVKGAVISVLLFVVLVFVFERVEGLPRSVPVIQVLCLILLLGGSRFLRRALPHGQRAPIRRAQNTIPILLVGAGEGAVLLIRCLKSSGPTAPYGIVGIVDLTDEHIGRSVLNVPILGTVHQLSEVLKRLNADCKRPHRIVLTTDMSGAQLIELQKKADHEHVPLARLPSLTQFRTASLDGRVDLHPIAVEDLLRRPQVALDGDGIDRLIEGRRILITGAGGSIGGELSRQIALRQPLELVLLDSSEPGYPG
jgi:FlaA1/EpsC-like NDP-sugar epimerase